MLNPIESTSKSLIHSTTASKIKLNDKYSLFTATNETREGNEVVSITETTGIALTESIDKLVSQCKVVTSFLSYFLMTDEMKRIIRLYGFPNHSHYSLYFNAETGKEENPFQLFNDELNKQDLTMDFFVKNPEKIHDVAIADHSDLVVFKLMNNEYVNQGIHCDRLNLSSSYVGQFETVINQLIEDKRFSYSGFGSKNQPTTYVPGNGKESFGYINFSDEEFNYLNTKSEERKLEKNEIDKPSNRFFAFSQLFFELDLLGISKYYYGFEKGDIYMTDHLE